MPMRALSVLLLALVIPVVAGARTTAVSGLRGQVTRGPITPVCVAEVPCSEPARNVALVFSHAGRTPARVVTDSGGRYRLRLAAGIWSVRRAASAGVDRGLEPNRVRVYAGRFVRVDFSIDTGIR
jgi:hypothetical protein